MLLNPFRFPSSGGGGGDPYWDSVVLLLNLDSNILDASTRGKVFTAAGDASVSSGALQLDGSGDWITTVDGMEDFRFGIGDFAVELFLLTSTVKEMVVLDWFRGGMGYWAFEVLTNGAAYWYSPSPQSSGVNVRTGTWRHVAFARQAGVFYFAVDGVIAASGAHSVNYNSTSVTAFSVGAQVDQRNPAYDYSGSVRGVRVTKGSARGYNVNFTPPSFPLPTGPA